VAEYEFGKHSSALGMTEAPRAGLISSQHVIRCVLGTFAEGNTT